MYFLINIGTLGFRVESLREVPAGKEERRLAGLALTSWTNFITTTSAAVLCMAKWRNISEEKPEYLLSTYK